MDEEYNGFRLYKWALLIRRSPNLGWEQNTVQNFICAQLLSLIDSHAGRKFVVYGGPLELADRGLLVSHSDFLWLIKINKCRYGSLHLI